MGTERARLGTFRAGPRGLSTQSSLKCLFVCLFVCLFIFPHKCTIGDKSLQISKQYPLHEQKLLVPPACVHNQNSKVCLFVCLSVCLFFRTNENYALLGINFLTSPINIRFTNKKYWRPPYGPETSSFLTFVKLSTKLRGRNFVDIYEVSASFHKVSTSRDYLRKCDRKFQVTRTLLHKSTFLTLAFNADQ